MLCGHLNLNQKRKKFKFGRLPVKPAGKPVKPAGKPVGTDWTWDFEFDFEFDRFPPISGQTGLVNRYRTAPVWPDRSVYLTLVLTSLPMPSDLIPIVSHHHKAPLRQCTYSDAKHCSSLVCIASVEQEQLCVCLIPCKAVSQQEL